MRTLSYMILLSLVNVLFIMPWNQISCLLIYRISEFTIIAVPAII